MSGPPPSWRETLTVVALAVVLAAAMTFPVAFRMDEAGRVDSTDGQWAIWNVAWVAHALTTNPTGLYQTNIFHPHTDTLAFAEANLVAGTLAVPAYLATGSAFVAHNSALLLAFVTSLLAMYALARYVAGSPLAALAPAVAFAYCPYVFARIPHISLQLTAGLPLCLLMLHRFVDRRTVGRALALGAALAVQALATGYYGIFAGLAVGLGVLFFACSRGLWRERAYWGLTALAAATAIVAVLPFLLPYFELQRATGFGRDLDEAVRYSADWRAYLASSAWLHQWMLPLIERWNEVLFPGFLLTAGGIAGLAVAGSRGQRPERELALFYLLVGVLAVWLSFGPQAGLYRVLYDLLPVFSFIRAPARFALLVPLALGVLMALGLRAMQVRLGARRGRLVAGGVALLVAIELVEAPIQWYDADPPTGAYGMLAELPEGPLVELPFYDADTGFERHAAYLVASTRHWRPLVNGYGDHFPAAYVEAAPQINSFPSPESFTRLAQVGARYVLVHFDRRGSPDRAEWMNRLATYRVRLTAVYEGPDAALYEIRPGS